MDPVSAVGIAAAAAQFIGIGIKAAALCKEIRDNADSSTDRNKALESLVRETRESRKELLTSPPQRVPRRISDLATKCAQAADELLHLLESVRGAGANTHVSTAKRLFRVMKEKKQIEKLERRVQEILEGLDNLQGSSEADNAQLVKEIEAIPTKLSSRLDGLETAVKKRLDQTDQTGAAFHKESRQMEFHEEFMQSLFFPEMARRESEIKDAAPGTLHWIYGQELVAESDGEDSIKWNRATFEGFVDWLRYDDCEYWISGKLGSGKSTLMSYIIDDQNTEKFLKVWSGTEDVLVLSFYFWRLGTDLQNTMSGLLRSLLYQICSAKRGSTSQYISRIMGKLGIERYRIPAWTEKTLTEAFDVAIHLLDGEHVCIFVDALDEYVGEYDNLFCLLRGVQNNNNSNVKLCVSSRPEVPLVRRLAHCKQLRLQDLNFDDICHFAKSKLENSVMDIQVIRDRTEEIAYRIAENAEGVFLWAILVTQAAIQGAECGDDTDIILRRIVKTPKIIEEIFASMLGKIDEFHTESLMFYSRLLEIANKVSPQAPSFLCRS
ncbi:hypothetical protein PG997_003249 [Apiospora hydei]|uniref:Nephrocystin 3-like N-terminal domain-containing protein n=1 Tax=Apiospora hydei TaxID=1337664 RepID=A0ABR1WYP2_9PEZI